MKIKTEAVRLVLVTLNRVNWHVLRGILREIVERPPTPMNWPAANRISIKVSFVVG